MRGSIRFFEMSMDKQLREKRALQQDLHSAISRGELELHYQPQAHIDGEITGFEASCAGIIRVTAWCRRATSCRLRKKVA
jgi:predicted signal transduction protein with EAL and GGDEF domain